MCRGQEKGRGHTSCASPQEREKALTGVREWGHAGHLEELAHWSDQYQVMLLMCCSICWQVIGLCSDN